MIEFHCNRELQLLQDARMKITLRRGVTRIWALTIASSI